MRPPESVQNITQSTTLTQSSKITGRKDDTKLPSLTNNKNMTASDHRPDKDATGRASIGLNGRKTFNSSFDVANKSTKNQQQMHTPEIDPGKAPNSIMSDAGPSSKTKQRSESTMIKDKKNAADGKETKTKKKRRFKAKKLVLNVS